MNKLELILGTTALIGFAGLAYNYFVGARDSFKAAIPDLLNLEKKLILEIKHTTPEETEKAKELRQALGLLRMTGYERWQNLLLNPYHALTFNKIWDICDKYEIPHAY